MMIASQGFQVRGSQERKVLVRCYPGCEQTRAARPSKTE